MSPVFGAIADDFTGATDLAALLHRKGLRVRLSIGVPEGANVDAEYDAVIVALKSRTIDAEKAVSMSRDAARYLTERAGATTIYFKYCSTFDSTDAGNIGPVLDALMVDLGVDCTVASPAFPENGRRVFLGHLFVGDRLLSESSLAHHPLTPMTDPDLVRVLSRQRPGPVARLDIDDMARGDAHLRNTVAQARAGTVFICDAVTDAHLEQMAEALPALGLYSGGSAMGAALAAVQSGGKAQDVLADAFGKPGSRYLFVSGSGSEMTRKQVSNALGAGYHGIRIDAETVEDPESAARDTLAAIAASGSKRPLVYASAEPEAVAAMRERFGRAEAGLRIERFFAALAPMARAEGFDAIVVAGGETSGAVVNGLGINQLEVGPEIAPGVPWMRAGDTFLALKSGNFGKETFFDDAVHSFEAAQ